MVLAIAALLQLLTIGAVADDELHADLTPLGMSARNGAPIPVNVRLEWDGSGIIEGRLDMEFHEGNRILGHYRSDEMALAGGEQKFRMLLPPILAPVSDAQVEVRLKFVTATKVIELDPSVLFVPTTSQRSLVVGWFEAGTEATQPAEVVRNLVFEQYAPPSDSPSERLATTSIARQTVEDLPNEPLAYTPFDVVVLSAEAFAEARERQLQALARWVKGGGSLCVFVAGTLQPYQIEFLNQLAKSDPNGPVFLTDSSGNLLPPSKDILCLRSGVGRSVIVTGEKAASFNLDTAAWRQVGSFLWKMRSSQAQAIADTGHWNPPQTLSPKGYRSGNYYQNMQYGAPYSLAVQPTTMGVELMDRLMPKTVRLIPFPALIGMLVLFLLLVGPADYYVLGFLRRRRLTWVVFPVMSLAFTAATVLMANHYLGLRDQRCSLLVVDLDKDGTALRWNRYELIFTARDKQSVTELKDALWAQLNLETPPNYYNPYYRPGYYPYGNRTFTSVTPDRELDPPQYDGILPVHFQTSETMRQWQPELNRIFSFEPPPAPLPANWSAIEKAWPNLQAIRAALSEKEPFNGDLFAIFGSSPMAASFSNGILDPAILSEICIGNPTGLQSLVSQVSPTGGGNFEDLPAMDTEGNDSVLVIVTRAADDIIVYRRFFYGN